MGRRSRKRAEEAGPGAVRPSSTRAERDAARRARAQAPVDRPARSDVRPMRPSRPRAGRPPARDRPPAPWGSFPLSELVIFIGIAILIWGVFSGEQGQERMVAGLVIASLGGGELALREHLAGFRSHSALLAGVAAFAVITVVVLTLAPVKLWLVTLVGVLVFAGSFYGFRELFKRRSGGVGFR